MTIYGNLVDILQRRIYTAELTIENGLIKSIRPVSDFDSHRGKAANYIIPGFIDAHVHIESSMLVPSEFARLAVVHGTVATVSDPHEIANVCGMAGIEFMIEDGAATPFKFYFGAPSCVPATTFETAGAVIDVKDVETLMSRNEVKYLSEMMNLPGLMGEAAKKYFEAGISTDHECFTRQEALNKLSFGAKILIREGSAAKNFEALIDLLNDYPEDIMFCSDDKHPDSLVAGHINQLCVRAVAKGIDLFKVLQAACINPVRHYKLDVGLLQVGDAADFIVVKDLQHFEVVKTFVNGALVAEGGKTLIGSRQLPISKEVNNFGCSWKNADDFVISATGISSDSAIAVIGAQDGQLITNKLSFLPKIDNGVMVSDADRDILKIAVVNRYFDAPIAKAFIQNFGLKRGAIASSVTHDSHNIVVVGVDDESIARAVNLVISSRGGVSCVDRGREMLLPLPVAGLMSAEDGYKVAEQYTSIDAAAKALGSTLAAPFMTLSFMALLVIPHLKLSDKGLFDGDRFEIMC
jgi:adenine deaminase